MASPTKPPDPAKKPDPELMAMSRIGKILGNLSPAAAFRVAAYVFEREKEKTAASAAPKA